MNLSTKFYGVAIQMKSVWQNFPFHMVLFIKYEVLPCESVDEIFLRCYHSNETSLTVQSHGTVCLSVFLK